MNTLRFRRSDPGVALVRIGSRLEFSPRRLRAAHDTSLRCTRVFEVGPLEHFLAAICILGVDGWILEATHPDLPLFDGSALAWKEAILATGSPNPPLVVPGPGSILEQADARGRIRIEPSSRLDLRVTWSRGPQGEETWQGDAEALPDLLSARTFVTAREFVQARNRGLLAGASPDCGRLFPGGDVGPEEADLAAVLGVDSRQEVWTGGVPRIPGECAAHKALDLIGDLYLRCGGIPQGKIDVVDAGHALHLQVGQRLAE